MGNLEACRELLNEYLHRMRMTHDDFAGAIGYTRPYVTKVLSGNEKISKDFIVRAVEAFAEQKVLQCRSEARELFALAGVDIPTRYWTRPAFVELKNDDPPESDGFKEQPQVPVTGQVAHKSTVAPNRSQEPPPAVAHTPLVVQSSENTNLQPFPQTSPALARRPKEIITRHKWAIAFSVILIVVALVGGSFVIDWFPLWGLFHKASATLPAVSWGTARPVTCDDLFNPAPQTPSSDNTATCMPTSNGHVTLSFSRLKRGYPEWDVKDGLGPSGPSYRVSLQMDLSPTNGVPQIAGCVLMDTRPDEDIGEVVCVHNSGLIEVLDAATLCTGCVWRHLEDGEVTINDSANVPVVVERVGSKLYIEVADQVIQPVDLTTPAGNVGFLAVGTQGSLQMSAIELA